MNETQEHLSVGDEDSSIIRNELLTALDALQPSAKRQKSALFSSAYPNIILAIARQVPQKEILVALGRNGLKLHPVRFREMLDAERKLRDERGDCVFCKTCGAALGTTGAETMASKLAHVGTQKEAV